MKANAPSDIPFLNVARTLAIFLVVLGHLPISHALYDYINHFHIPVFFLISGYLISEEMGAPFLPWAGKKVRTLLVPYYLFALIALAFWYFVGRKFGDDAASQASLADYFWGMLAAVPTKGCLGFDFPLWFLPSLFCAEVLFYGIHRVAGRWAFVVSLVGLGIGIGLKEMQVIRLPYGVDVSLFALPFLQVGRWLRQGGRMERYVCRPPWAAKLVLAASLLGLAWYIALCNRSQEWVAMVYRTFNHYSLYFVGAVSGSLGLLYASCLWREGRRFFTFFGRNTILILSFHLMALSVIKGVQVMVLGIPLEAVERVPVLPFLYAALTFVLLGPVIYVVNRYSPSLLGRKKGIY
jgi:fucose 4-O-acetylase-like acetyltransferase